MKPPCLLQPRHGDAAGGDDRARIEVHDAVILLVGHLGIGDAAEHAAGIVDQAVEPAEMLGRLLDDAGDVGRKREIALGDERPRRPLADFGSQLFGRFAAFVVVQADLAALLGIGAGKCCADAGRGAGDQHGLAGEIGDGEGEGIWQAPWRRCKAAPVLRAPGRPFQVAACRADVFASLAGFVLTLSAIGPRPKPVANQTSFRSFR